MTIEQYCVNIKCSNFNQKVDIPVYEATMETPAEAYTDCCQRCGHAFMDDPIDTEYLLEVIEDQLGHIHNFHYLDDDALIKAIINELERQRSDHWKKWREDNNAN